MNPFFDRLRTEHQHALKQLALLGEASARLRDNGYSEEDHAAVTAAVRFINNEVRAHNEREEQYLFPEMERVMPPNGPTAVMRAEHRTLWEDLNTLEQVLPGVTAASGKDVFVNLHGSAMAVVNLLGNHIMKEDNILFPMAEAHLSPAQLEHLAKVDADLAL